MRTRPLWILLALCMALSLLSGTALAEDNWTPYEAGAQAGGNYTISTAKQLRELAETVNGTVNGDQPYANTYFKLTEDIDLSSVCGASIGGEGEVSWTPIGNNDRGFMGAFDGNNHKITGLYIHSTGKRQGLFGRVGMDGSVQDLSVEGSVTVDSEKDGDGIFVGGVVGLNEGTMANCSYSGNITVNTVTVADINNHAYVGGVAGLNDGMMRGNSGTMTGCSYTGNITVTGIAGEGQNGYTHVGGVAGDSNRFNNPDRTVSDCYNTGNITVEDPNSYAYVGGVAGQNSGSRMTNCRNTGNIKAVDSVTGEDLSEFIYAGGVTGQNLNNGSVSDCYNTGDVTVEGPSDTLYFYAVYAGGVVGHNFGGTVTNCYNADNHITVDNIKNENPSGSVHINAGGVVGFNDGRRTVTNCHNKGDVTVKDIVSASVHAGGVAGYISDGSVENCYNIGNVSGEAPDGTVYAGGVAGYISNGLVENCYNIGGVTVKNTGHVYAGGVVGENFNRSAAARCYNDGGITVSGITAEDTDDYVNVHAGGVVGECDSGSTAADCYNTGDITVGSVTGSILLGSVNINVGGAVGANRSGSTVINCYHTGNITVGAPSGNFTPHVNAGSVAGESSGDSTVRNCYYLKPGEAADTPWGIGSSSGDTAGAAEALTDTEMKEKDSFVGWDFNEIWAIYPTENGGYPYLFWQYAVHVTGVRLNKTSLTLAVGGSRTLTVTVEPAIAADKSVSWDSSDDTVATVSDAGVVKALKEGTAVITVTAADGGKTAECTVTVTAASDAAAYTITFDANGGSVDPKTGTTGTDGKLTDLPTPTRDGYTFNGWYTAASGGKKVTTATVFSEDATIYAHWTKTGSAPTPGDPSSAAYTITFDANGGSVDSKTGTTGTDGKLTKLPTPTRDGYTFDGWYTAASGGEKVTTATVFSEDTTVYAHWAEDKTSYNPDVTYMISLDGSPSRGGSVTGIGSYKGGESVTVTASPTSGYRFVRWTENGRHVSASAEYTFTVTDSRALTAEFEPITGSASSSGGSAASHTTNTGSGSAAASSSPNAGGGSAALRSPFIKNTVDSMPRMPSITSIPSYPSVSSTPSMSVASSGPFSDVPGGSTFSSAITWAQSNGVMGGYADGTFRPYAGTNRQQMWMALARLSGANPASMAEARTWAINAGISDGSDAEGTMSRQQMAAMIYRFAKSQGVTTSGSADLSAYFDSGDVAPYAREAMAWAVGNGFITGVADGTLKANGTAVRAHFVTFLYRFSRIG